jgi:AraC family transcriptional regulator
VGWCSKLCSDRVSKRQIGTCQDRIANRCLWFHFTPEYFEAITAGTGAGGADRGFRSLRLPPVRTLSPVIADGCAALAGSTDVAWEELGIRLAARAVEVDGGADPDRSAISPAAVARVTRTVRLIEGQPATDLTLVRLSREARLSPFHYLRTFESLTGAAPHQYLLRTRLRTAATRLATEPARILDVALDAGFGDVSNFNRAFRAEFGVSPRFYRQYRRRVESAMETGACLEQRLQIAKHPAPATSGARAFHLAAD